MIWWFFVPVMVLAMMLLGIVATLAARTHRDVRAAASICALSVVVIPVALVLHNLLGAVVGDDEPVTFALALLAAPASFAVGATLVARQLRHESADTSLSRSFTIASTGVVLMVLYIAFALVVDQLALADVALRARIESIVLPLAALVTAFGAAMGAIAIARENAIFA